jgi:2-C-methyl-D-erythritol 4-phosphate cytidylyltransferase
MLGLIVVAPESGPGLAPHALLEELLGAPLLTRAIASALPTLQPVTGVLVVPDDLVEQVRAEVVDRFALDEIDKVVGGGPDRAAAVKAGLAELPADVETVIVHDGSFVLAPVGLVDRALEAAADKPGAAPVRAIRSAVVRADGERLARVDGVDALRVLQSPVVLKAASLRAALGVEGGEDRSHGFEGESPALWVAQQGDEVALVDGDVDNIRLSASADVSRAVEVFSRRAVDYAFVYPKDLLPDDPLAKALHEGAEAAVGNGEATVADDADGEHTEPGMIAPASDA